MLRQCGLERVSCSGYVFNVRCCVGEEEEGASTWSSPFGTCVVNGRDKLSCPFWNLGGSGGETPEPRALSYLRYHWTAQGAFGFYLRDLCFRDPPAAWKTRGACWRSFFGEHQTIPILVSVTGLGQLLWLP